MKTEVSRIRHNRSISVAVLSPIEMHRTVNVKLNADDSELHRGSSDSMVGVDALISSPL